jgi:hypothetical protein
MKKKVLLLKGPTGHKGKVQSRQRAGSQPEAQGENPRRLGYRKPRAQAQGTRTSPEQLRALFKPNSTEAHGQGLYQNNLGPLVQAQFQ